MQIQIGRTWMPIQIKQNDADRIRIRIQIHNQSSESVTCLYESGSSDPYFWLTDPDPALFISDLRHAKQIFFNFWRSFLTDKKSSRSHKILESEGASYYFCLMMGGSGSGTLSTNTAHLYGSKSSYQNVTDLEHRSIHPDLNPYSKYRSVKVEFQNMCAH